MEFVGTGFVRGGRLVVRNPARFLSILASWRDCEVDIIIAKKYAIRSELQNRWYFGAILRAIAAKSGHTRDELHEFFKQQFNAKHVAILDDHGDVIEERIIGDSTTKLNRLTFGEYCDRIRQFAAERMDLDIPDPDPDWRERSS